MITVGRIVLNLPRRLDDNAKDREAIREAVAERVRQDPLTEFDPKARDASHTLQLSAGVVVPIPGESTEARPVTVRLRPRRDGREYEAGGRGLPLADAESSVLTGFDAAWEIIDQERWLDIGDDARLIQALRHPDSSLRDFAIQRLGERKSVAAVDALGEILGSLEEDPDRVLRAVGALVAIGDRRAVDPLIDLTRRKDPRFVIQVVFALSGIGGPTAQGYLVTLASGHPVEAVRESAKDALGEMSP